MQDMSRMTLGMWVDYCIQYNNDEQAAATGDTERVTIREATQEDIDKLARR